VLGQGKKSLQIVEKGCQGKRKRHTAQFKSMIAFEMVKVEESISEIATRYGIHPL